MKGFLIFLAVSAFILWLPAGVRLVLKDELELRLEILGLSFRLVPGKPAKIPVARFTAAYLRKLEAKNAAREAKADQKEEAKAAAKAEKAEAKKREKEAGLRKKHSTDDILELIRAAAELSGILIKCFFGHLHVKIRRLSVRVATGDAAGTAMLTQAVRMAAGALLDLLEEGTKPDGDLRKNVSVEPDFTGEKISCELDIRFRVHVFAVFALLFRGLSAFIPRRKPILKVVAPNMVKS